MSERMFPVAEEAAASGYLTGLGLSGRDATDMVAAAVLGQPGRISLRSGNVVRVEVRRAGFRRRLVITEGPPS
jgi:hypothetical protein